MTEYKLNKTVLVVEVPEAKEYWTNNGFLHIGELQGDAFSVALTEGNWKILSLSKEMTEEKAKVIMPTHHNDKELYRNFVSDGYFRTAIQSFHSFLQSIKMPCVNPYGNKPVFKGAYNADGYDNLRDIEEKNEFRNQLKQWQQAEQSVKNTIILYKD